MFSIKLDLFNFIQLRKGNNNNLEHLLFYAFATSDVDAILSGGFNVSRDGLDDVVGIPFTDSPSLTIGHGSCGLLLCRVQLGHSVSLNRKKFLAGDQEIKAAFAGGKDSVLIELGSNETIYVVKSASQIVPYSVVRLAESLTAKTIAKYLESPAAGQTAQVAQVVQVAQVAQAPQGHVTQTPQGAASGNGVLPGSSSGGFQHSYSQGASGYQHQSLNASTSGSTNKPTTQPGSTSASNGSGHHRDTYVGSSGTTAKMSSQSSVRASGHPHQASAAGASGTSQQRNSSSSSRATRLVLSNYCHLIARGTMTPPPPLLKPGKQNKPNSKMPPVALRIRITFHELIPLRSADSLGVKF